MSSTTRSDLRETSGPRINRIPPTRPAVMAGPSRLRIANIFSPPQEVSHRSLWTISEPNDTQTIARRFCIHEKTGFSGLRGAFYGRRRITTPSQRHPKVNKGPLTQKIYQKRRARAPLWAARAGQLCPGFSGGDQSSVSGRGASAHLSRSRACGRWRPGSRSTRPCAR